MEGTFRPESWIASAVVALASFQLYSALWLYGKLNRRRATPPWLTKVHRLSGVLALVASTAVAYHCLVAYGFRNDGARAAGIWMSGFSPDPAG